MCSRCFEQWGLSALRRWIQRQNVIENCTRMKQSLGRDCHKWLDGQMGGYQKWWEFDLNFILINSCNSRWNEIVNESDRTRRKWRKPDKCLVWTFEQWGAWSELESALRRWIHNWNNCSHLWIHSYPTLVWFYIFSDFMQFSEVWCNGTDVFFAIKNRKHADFFSAGFDFNWNSSKVYRPSGNGISTSYSSAVVISGKIGYL